MKRVLDFVKESKACYLATVDENGMPQVRAFGTLCEWNGKLYFQTGKVKAMYKEMLANPNVAIMNFNREKGSWFRIQAKAVCDDRVEANEAILEIFPNLKDRYAADDGNCVVFYLEDVSVLWQGFGAADEIVKL